MLTRRIPDYSETPEVMFVSLVDIDNMSYGDNVATAENTDAGRWHIKKQMMRVAKILDDVTFSISVLNMN